MTEINNPGATIILGDEGAFIIGLQVPQGTLPPLEWPHDIRALTTHDGICLLIDNWLQTSVLSSDDENFLRAGDHEVVLVCMNGDAIERLSMASLHVEY